MTVQRLIPLIEAQSIAGSGADGEIRGGFMSDIMSRAIAEGFSGMAWITHRADLNALAVAVMKNAACMIFPEGIRPEENAVRQAQKENVPLLSSKLTAFEIAGRLYAAGLCSGEDEKK